MQIPIIPHRGQKKPWNSIPRINWNNPLTNGLISYGYDVGCGPVDLVTGGLCTIANSTTPPFGGIKSSPFGTGLNSVRTASVTSGLYNLPSGKNIENLVVAAPYSFACGLMITTAPTVDATLLFATCSATTSVPVSLGCANTSSTDYWWAFADGANNASAAGALKINTFQTLLGVALTGSTTACYVDGTLSISPAVTTTLAVVAGVRPSFHGYRSFAGQQLQSCFIYYGALWKNRALTAKEARKLHDDPYCFLIYPEDEIFAENVAVTTSAIFPLMPSWEPQPTQTKVVTYG